MSRRKIYNLKHLKFLDFDGKQLRAEEVVIDSQKLTPKRKSSFNWSSLGFFVVVILFFVTLRERAWSGAVSREMKYNLDQVSKSTYENQLIFEEITDFYRAKNLETIGFVEPVREYIVLPSITRK